MTLSTITQAMKNKQRVKLRLQDGGMKKAHILKVINNRYVIIDERKLLMSFHSVVEVQDISAVELN